MVDSIKKDDQSKINPIISKILKLNQNQFDSYSVFEVGNIQKEEELTMEKMKEVINSLANNLKEFTKELQQEKVQYVEKMEAFFIGADGEFLQKEITELLNKLAGQEELGLIEQQPDLANQIVANENILKELINSAKDKLESKDRWTFTNKREEKTKERQLFLKIFLDNPEKLTASQKELLEKKITKEGLNQISQVSQELRWLRLNLQNEQTTSQILPTNPPFSSNK